MFTSALFNNPPSLDSLKIATYSITESYEIVFDYKILCGNEYLEWEAWESVVPQDAPMLVYKEATFRLEFSTYYTLNKHESWVVQGEWAERGLFDGRPIKAVLVNSIERKPISPEALTKAMVLGCCGG